MQVQVLFHAFKVYYLSNQQQPMAGYDAARCFFNQFRFFQMNVSSPFKATYLKSKMKKMRLRYELFCQDVDQLEPGIIDGIENKFGLSLGFYDASCPQNPKML